MSMSKIRVSQVVWGDLSYADSWFAKYVEPINSAYCRLYGYDYVVEHLTPTRPDRHVNWEKVPHLNRMLTTEPIPDYLLYVDADAVFYSHVIPIEDGLMEHLGENDILITCDCGQEACRWNPNKPNVGIMLLRNTEECRHIIKEWDTVSDMPEHTNTRWTWPVEQKAFQEFCFPRYGNCIKMLDDYYIMNGAHGQYIRHFAGYPNEGLASFFEHIYNSNVMKRNFSLGIMRYIVSLTSFGRRIEDGVPKAVQSIIDGTVKPDAIVLYLGNEWTGKVPASVKELETNGLEIRFREDVGAHTKLLYALQEFPDCCIITIDDDCIYQKNTLALLQKGQKKYPGMVICLSGVPMRCDRAGMPLRRMELGWDVTTEDNEGAFMPCGWAGILYPPNALGTIFHKDVTDVALFKELCPTEDDVWWWMMALLGSETSPWRVVDNAVKPTQIDGYHQLGGTGLWLTNHRSVSENNEIGSWEGHDIYWRDTGGTLVQDKLVKSLFEHYPEGCTKLLKTIPTCCLDKYKETPAQLPTFSRFNLDWLPTFYIAHVRESFFRCSRLQKNLQNVGLLNYQIVEGFNGWHDTPIHRHNRPGHNEGHYGCALSKLEIIEKHGGNNIIFLGEDDARFDPDWRERLLCALSVIPDDWEILHLGSSAWEGNAELVGENLYTSPLFMLMTATLIRGERLQRAFCDFTRGDWFLDGQSHGHCDFYLAAICRYLGIVQYGIYPTVARQIDGYSFSDVGDKNCLISHLQK
jgi:hypothetical protein